MDEKRLNPNDIGKLDTKETLAITGDTGEETIGENAVEMDQFVNDD
jgi:hypothetical protein